MLSVRSIASAVPLLIWLIVPLFAQPGPRKAWSDSEVMQVHRSALLIDLHNDVTSSTVDGYDFVKGLPAKHTDLARLKAGGTGAQFFAAYVDGSYAANKRAAHRALQMIDTIKTDIIGRSPDTFAFATSAAQIEAARKAGRIAALVGIEGGHAIEDDLRLLRTFFDLGVRYMTLTHNQSNSWAGSSLDKQNPGLTPFGKSVVAEMNRLGMMVDVSHVSDKTFWDVLATSSAPIIASHSSCRALTPAPRNMTDEMIKAIAEKGGVVHVNFRCAFVTRKKDQRATIDDVVAHIMRVRDVGGIGAVGLGSDFDGIECVPSGLEDVSKWPALTRKLLEAGFTPDDIRKIYGANTLRVMRAVEKAATRAGVR
jgi:membrane dipeptidase